MVSEPNDYAVAAVGFVAGSAFVGLFAYKIMIPTAPYTLGDVAGLGAIASGLLGVQFWPTAIAQEQNRRQSNASEDSEK